MDESRIILALFKENEKKAFKLLFLTYNRQLLLYCHRIVGDLQVAEDILQETFTTFWVNKMHLSFEGNLGHFLFKSIKNAALNYNRDTSRRKDLHKKWQSGVDYESAPREEDELKQIDTLYVAVNNLPEMQRKVLLKICTENKKYKEVAEELGISVNTVQTHLKRAVSELRASLDKEDFSIILFVLTQIN